MDGIIKKEQFLIEHNKLSPVNLQATFAMLTRFQEEKRPLLKDTEWSFKLRVPFISWLMVLTPLDADKKKPLGKNDQEYRNYPETH